MPEWTVAQVATLVGGSVDGDGERRITGLSTLCEAGESDLAFYDDTRYTADFAATRAGAVLVKTGAENPGGRTLIRVENPHLALARLADEFHRELFPDEFPPGVDPTATVAPDAEFGEDARVGPHAFVGPRTKVGARARIGANAALGADCVVGDDFFLFPNATIYPRCRIGSRVRLHSGVVVGNDGYGYVEHAGEFVKIPHVGTVEIGDDVEVGPGSTIHRASVGATRIGKGTKIDALVVVAHSCQVGEYVRLIAQCGLAGSSRVEERAIIGPQAGLAGHLIIGEGAIVAGQAGIMTDLEAGAIVWGTPSGPIREMMRSYAVFRHLPEMRRGLKKVKADLAAVKAKLGK